MEKTIKGSVWEITQYTLIRDIKIAIVIIIFLWLAKII